MSIQVEHKVLEQVYTLVTFNAQMTEAHGKRHIKA
jgi:hypothetical protein